MGNSSEPPSPRNAKQFGRCTQVQRFCVLRTAPLKARFHKALRAEPQKEPSRLVPNCFALGERGTSRAQRG